MAKVLSDWSSPIHDTARQTAGFDVPAFSALEVLLPMVATSQSLQALTSEWSASCHWSFTQCWAGMNSSVARLTSAPACCNKGGLTVLSNRCCWDMHQTVSAGTRWIPALAWEVCRAPLEMPQAVCWSTWSSVGVGSQTLSALVQTMVVPTMAMGRAQLSSELTRLLASGSSSWRRLPAMAAMVPPLRMEDRKASLCTACTAGMLHQNRRLTSSTSQRHVSGSTTSTSPMWVVLTYHWTLPSVVCCKTVKRSGVGSPSFLYLDLTQEGPTMHMALVRRLLAPKQIQGSGSSSEISSLESEAHVTIFASCDSCTSRKPNTFDQLLTCQPSTFCRRMEPN